MIRSHILPGQIFAVISVMSIVSPGLSSQAQQRPAHELYLFSAVPYSDDSNSPRAGSLAVDLFRLVDRRLRPIPLEEQPPRFTRYVITDPEKGQLALCGSPLMPTGFQLMSMDRPGEVRTFEITEQGRGLALSHFVDIPGKPLQLLFNFFNDDVGNGGKPLTELLRTFDTHADQWVPTPPDVYRYVRITGGRSGYRQGGDELGLRQFEGGQLVIPRAQRVFQIGPPLPKQLWFSPEDGPSLFLNNSYMTVVSNLVLVRTSKQISYLVLEKHSGEWRRLTIPGNASWNVRAFRSWIAGMVEESLYGEQFLISPGRHKPIPRNQFDTVDGYLQNEAIYRPGKLFLYDVPGRRYYQWDTHDADSEVILVEDGQVYYRVDQAIYRAKIGEKELDKPELLVEDKEVPGIHWAFFGPTTPVAAAPAAGRK